MDKDLGPHLPAVPALAEEQRVGVALEVIGQHTEGTGGRRDLPEWIVELPLRLHEGLLRHFGRIIEAIGQACNPPVDVPQDLLAVSQGGTCRPKGLFDAIGQRSTIDVKEMFL